MQPVLPTPKNPYLLAEISFFVGLFWLFPILTDLEYSGYEKQAAAAFLHDIDYRLLYGTVNLVGFGVFYKWIVQRVLFGRRYALFLGTFLLFLVGFNCYLEGVYYLIGHTPLFPADWAADARRYTHQWIHFSVVYMCMQCLCITALAYFIRSARQEQQVRALREAQHLAELNYLRARLHPHFFFNTLNNIYALALQRSADTAPLVARLAALMRYMLYEASPPKVSLKKEVDFLADYIAVEKWRCPETIQVTFDVQGITARTLIEPLLLLPFVENAFKHGVAGATGPGFVRVILCMIGDDLHVEIGNSKPAAPGPCAPKGIGQPNALRRLDLLYAGRYVLDITETEDRYELFLTLRSV